MNLYLAPEKYIDIYMKNMIYKSQKIQEKGVAVDTAGYCIEVDDRYLKVRTSEDGWWGKCTEIYRETGNGRVSDATIITVWIPEEEGFEGMKRMSGYLFENLQLIEKEPETKVEEM